MTKINPSPENKLLASAHNSLANQPINSLKGFDVTKIDRIDPAIIEALIANNDLSALGPQQKAAFIKMLCESLGLNPLSRPLQLVEFKDPENYAANAPKKLTVYATKDCAEQLRKLHGVSVIKLDREIVENIVIYTAYVTDKHGREDVSTGAVSLMTNGTKAYENKPAVPPALLGPQGKANAIMKAETKAKRRATLSICGLGFLDETEIADLVEARTVELPDLATDQPAPDTEEGPAQPTATPIQAPEGLKEDSSASSAKTFGECMIEIQNALTKPKLTIIKDKYLPLFKSEQVKQSITDKLNLRMEEIKRSTVRKDSDPAKTISKPGAGLFPNANQS